MLFCYGIGVTTIVAKSIKIIISTINNNNLLIALISLKNLMTSQTTFRQRHVNPMVSNKWCGRAEAPVLKTNPGYHRMTYTVVTSDAMYRRHLDWSPGFITENIFISEENSLHHIKLYHHNTPPTLTEQSYSKTTKTKGSSQAFVLKPKIYSWMSVWVRLQDSEESDI